MSKAIVGAVELAGAAVLDAIALTSTGGIAAAWQGVFWGLVAGGISAEAGAIAGAIGSQGGIGVTVRQPAGNRKIVRGMQRIGGTIVYMSTTGSTHRQQNMVIVLATHEIDAITDLYLDGRKVFWNTSSAGNQTRNGANFGGDADGSNHTGPNGQQYNFGGKVFCRAYWGDQNATTGYSTDLHANDPTWAPTSQGTPYLGGCAWVYLKLEADSATFPQLPEIKFTIRGKNDIYDPRTATTGYTDNWALHVADAIGDAKWGVGDGPVSSWGADETAQLIAAANVCDESVTTSVGSEKRYCLHCTYDTGMSPGEVVARMMDVAAGRLVEAGGVKRFIFPAYWQGPSLSFGADDLAGSPQWNPNRSLSELSNRVTGKYTAPGYPWNVAGNLYDSHGYWEGMTADHFPFAFQPSDFPMYAADELHGYGTGVDVYLTEDGGIRLPLDIDLTWCLSITQAQRVAKIRLLRNRHQGSGELPMKISALQAMCTDVIQFTFPVLGWANKVLEIDGDKAITIRCGKDEGGVPCFTMSLNVRETDASVYSWSSAEELSPYDVPAMSSGISVFSVAAITGLNAVSDLSTALIQPDGTVTPRVKLTWDEPTDTYITTGGSILVQMCAHGSAAWETQAVLDGQATQVYLRDVIAGQTYDVRVAARRSSGAQSDWTELDGVGIGVVLTSPGSGAVAPSGTLTAYTIGPTSSYILVANFTASFAGFTKSCTPSPSTLGVNAPGQRWWVYYHDATFAGGAITPVATQNTADFVGRPGYYLIGSIIPPAWTVTYPPSAFSDFGSMTTNFPERAFDGSPAAAAVVPSYWQTWNTTGIPGPPPPDVNAEGNCIWSGFPALTFGASKTLHVTAGASASTGGTSWAGTVVVSIGGTATTLVTFTATNAGGDYTLTIPAGTDLSTITVQVSSVIASGAAPGTAGAANSGSAEVDVYEIWVQ